MYLDALRDPAAVLFVSTRGRREAESFLCGVLVANRPETIENSVLQKLNGQEKEMH